MRCSLPTLALVSTLVAASAPAGAAAQESIEVSGRPRAPISIGNYPNVNGLRINFRDENLGRVNGMNVTVWTPVEPMSGVVKGIALGLPSTGAARIEGLGIGVFGIGAADRLSGVMRGGLGAGAGGKVSGIAIGGIGVGTGGDLSGIMIGGVGAGGGGNASGFLMGGVGAGVGGSFKGVAVGGVGVGAGGNGKGIVLGGVGAGVGGNFTGVAIGGVGAGAGGTFTGFAIGGVGIGAGESLRGAAIGGVGVGAPRLEGGFLALVVGAKDARAIVIAPAYFKIERDGSFRGGALSAVNYIKGSQHGLTIGLVNYARSLHGLQVGVLNIIADQREHPVLPLVNWGAR